MRVLQGLLILILVLVVGAVAVGFMLPQRAHLERSIFVERPPATVFAVLNGYRHFAAWSPWSALDPAMQVSIEGPMHGVGARYTWSSAQESVGSGSQEILESVPYSHVRVALSFSGMDSTNHASFLLTPQGEGTRVVWTHDAEFGGNLLGRYFGLLLDRMVGPDYQRGLARLKQYVETLPAADFADLDVEVVTVQARPVATLAGRSATNPQAIAQAYADAFARISAVLARSGLKPAGPRLVVGRKWDASRGEYEFDAAIPVPPRVDQLRADREVKLGATQAGTMLKTTHRGPYGDLSAHFQKLMAYKLAMGYADNGLPWDVYVSDPVSTPASELITETYVPVR